MGRICSDFLSGFSGLLYSFVGLPIELHFHSSSPTSVSRSRVRWRRREGDGGDEDSVPPCCLCVLSSRCSSWPPPPPSSLWPLDRLPLRAWPAGRPSKCVLCSPSRPSAPSRVSDDHLSQAGQQRTRGCITSPRAPIIDAMACPNRRRLEQASLGSARLGSKWWAARTKTKKINYILCPFS